MSHHSSRIQSSSSSTSQASRAAPPPGAAAPTRAPPATGPRAKSHSVVLGYGPFDVIAAPPANLYTGPDNLRHHMVSTNNNPQFVGNGLRSFEQTSQMSYLTRPAPESKFPLAKNGRIGEIGWPVEYFKVVKGV